jgi:hypothetical protein
MPSGCEKLRQLQGSFNATRANHVLYNVLG